MEKSQTLGGIGCSLTDPATVKKQRCAEAAGAVAGGSLSPRWGRISLCLEKWVPGSVFLSKFHHNSQRHLMFSLPGVMWTLASLCAKDHTMTVLTK